MALKDIGKLDDSKHDFLRSKTRNKGTIDRTSEPDLAKAVNLMATVLTYCRQISSRDRKAIANSVFHMMIARAHPETSSIFLMR